MALDTTKTAHEIITSGRSTGQTVIDSDGNLKWAMENLYRNGAGGVQAITVVSGVDYTIRAASGSIAYSGAATGTLDASAGVSRVEVTASTTTLTITPTDATEIAVYRSDLAGMQFDKFGSDYLPNETGAALYGPGIDYSTGRGGLQVYEGRTNLVERFAITKEYWVTTTTTDLAENLFGVFPGVAMESTGVISSIFPNPNNFAVTSGLGYAVTILWGGGQMRLRVDNVGTGSSVATITAAGVFANPGTTQGSVLLASHDEVATGVYKTTFVWTPNFTGAANFALGHNSDVSGTITKFYAAQFEAGSSASPLIPTYGSSVTRGADDLTTLVSSFGYNVNAGTVVVDFVTLRSASNFDRVYQFGSGTLADGKVSLELGSDNILKAYVDDVAALSLGASPASGVTSKVAHSFQTDDFAASKDGGAAVTDTSGTLPAVNTSLFYGSETTGKSLNGLIYSLAYYPFAASDEQLVEASS